MGLSESDGWDSDLAYILGSDIYEDIFSVNSSPPSSIASHEGLPSLEPVNSALGHIQEFIQEIENTVSTSSYSWSTVSSGADEQAANVDDVNNTHEEVAESTL